MYQYGYAGTSKAMKCDILRKLRYLFYQLGKQFCWMIRIVRLSVGMLENVFILFITVAEKLPVGIYLIFEQAEHFYLFIG